MCESVKIITKRKNKYFPDSVLTNWYNRMNVQNQCKK